jgi:CRP-like cAMP-binding protein
VLAQLPLFEGVPKRHLGRIARSATTRRFSQMTRIVQADDAGNTFYVLLDGQVSVLRNGRRIARMGAGEAFGELALLTDAPRAATVVADTDVLALCLSRAAFNRVLKSEPAVSVALLRTLAERVRASERSHAH